ncbi:SigE family RNA polymerase sigma factor, partial [Streptomyces sp. NPDC056290]
MAEVLDFTAPRGTVLRPPRQALRPRTSGAPGGGMPVIAPMPAARPTRIPGQRDG